MAIEQTPSGKYRVRWRTPEGDRSQTVERWSDAVSLQAKVKRELDTGTHVDRRDGKVPFRDFAEEWRSNQVHRPGTASQVETNLRVNTYPTLGKLPLNAIKPSDVQRLVKSLSQRLSPGTVELVFRYLVAIFNSAVADRLIPSSPCVKIRLPKAEKAKLVPLPTEGVERLFEVVPPRYKALVVMVAGTGLRQGEAFGVAWDRVDLDRRLLRVDQQVALHVGSPPVLAPLKTEASYRTIPIPNVVVDALAAHRSAYESGPWKLAFTNDKGEPISRTRFGDVWRRAVAEAGLPAGTGMHALRHYYASLLIYRGVSVTTVQARLGHATAAETLDTYSHLWPDSDDDTREAVDQVLGGRVSDRVSDSEE